jgi:hypothetical protein
MTGDSWLNNITSRHSRRAGRGNENMTDELIKQSQLAGAAAVACSDSAHKNVIIEVLQPMFKNSVKRRPAGIYPDDGRRNFIN